MHRWNRGINVSQMGLVRLCTWYILVAHWYGCVWMAMHRFAEPHEARTWARSGVAAVFLLLHSRLAQLAPAIITQLAWSC